MTCHPVEANHCAWWLCCGRWRRLHAIPGDQLTAQEMRDSIDLAQPLHCRAACGVRSDWSMPGMGSRLGLPRCAGCCDALGIARGDGTPANEADLGEREARDA